MNERTKRVLTEAFAAFIFLITMASITGILLFAFAAPARAAEQCNWNNPGAAPYRVGKSTAQLASEALIRYTDISPTERRCLIGKIISGNSDATLFITRDGIISPDGAATAMRDMNYSQGKVCWGPVLREKWTERHEEPALLYTCGSAQVAQAVVCGNFFRVDFERKPAPEPSFRSWIGPYEPRQWDKQAEPNKNGADGLGLYRRINEVPEPGTITLALLGLAGIAAARKWRS